MIDEINIQLIAQRDDVDLAAEYLKTVDGPNELHNNVNDGNKYSAAWIAAFCGARNVIRLFVQAGADLEYAPKSGITVRGLGLLNFEVLLGMTEGGMVPSGNELGVIFLSKYSTELPIEASVQKISELIKFDPNFSFERDVEDIHDFIEDENFQKIVYFSDISPENFIQMMDVEETRDQLISLGVNSYQLMALLTQRAMALMMTHSVEIEEIIVRRFRGYRKNRSWLSNSAASACDEMCARLAPIYDQYEDDEDLRFLCNLILSRFPIKERITGAGWLVQPSRLSGQVFEREVTERLISDGFGAEQIGQTGDQGADVVARKSGLSFAIQCKDYTSAVGNAAVQQVLAAKAFYRTDYAVVCASTGFTKSAKILGATAGVILISPAMLPELMTLRLIVD